MTDSLAYDVAVVGTGPAGLAAALSLAQQGFRVAAIGAQPPRRDTRTAALFGGSVTLMENLGLSAVCRDAGEPVYGIRIIDDMGGLLRAPPAPPQLRGSLGPLHRSQLHSFGSLRSPPSLRCLLRRSKRKRT